MSLPVASSRPITVDGQSYRWSVARVSSESSWALLVQTASGPGRVLAVEIQSECEGMFWLLETVGPVTPESVRLVIDQARRLGWDPSEPGKWLWAHVGNGALELGRARARVPEGSGP